MQKESDEKHGGTWLQKTSILITGDEKRDWLILSNSALQA